MDDQILTDESTIPPIGLDPELGEEGDVLLDPDLLPEDDDTVLDQDLTDWN
ncbi:MAG: hypothetical protein WC385_03700 [Candidatus Paceibacterota bacterium]|jgi:hypothetical protein